MKQGKNNQKNQKKISDNFNLEVFILTICISLLLQILCLYLFANKIDKLEQQVNKEGKLLEEFITGQTTSKTVFFGDSITERYNIDKFYENDDYINQGSGGETSSDLLKRMKKSIYDYNPERVILLIGINDLNRDKEVDEVHDNIEEIVTKILNYNISIKVDVISVLPVNRNFKGRDGLASNKTIKELNTKLEKLCSDLDVNYIDAFSSMTDKEGSLKEEYTDDGLHLSDKGYQHLTSVINKAIKK